MGSGSFGQLQYKMTKMAVNELQNKDIREIRVDQFAKRAFTASPPNYNRPAWKKMKLDGVEKLTQKIKEMHAFLFGTLKKIISMLPAETWGQCEQELDMASFAEEMPIGRRVQMLETMIIQFIGKHQDSIRFLSENPTYRPSAIYRGRSLFKDYANAGGLATYYG